MMLEKMHEHRNVWRHNCHELFITADSFTQSRLPNKMFYYPLPHAIIILVNLITANDIVLLCRKFPA